MQAVLPKQRAVKEDPAQPAEDPPRNGDARLLEFVVRHSIADGEEQAIEEAVERVAIEHSGADVRDQSLPESRIVEQCLGRDLPDVLTHGFRGLGEVQNHPIDGMRDQVQRCAADPRQRKKREIIVGVAPPIDLVIRLRRVEEIGVSEHCALWIACGAGGVAKHRVLIGLSGGDHGLQGFVRTKLPTTSLSLHSFKCDQPGIIVMPHAPIIPVDHLLHQRQLRLDRKQLVALLLVTCENEGRIRMRNDELHFRRRHIREETHNGRACAHDPQGRP